MSCDWVKIRTDLYRDPKVCAMADAIMDPEGDLARYVNQHCQMDMVVTRNVMRNVTVGALVSVWGVMRLRGKRSGLDLRVHGCAASVLDDVADIPGFGDAMALVGWVVEDENGLIFPRFFEDYNTDPSDSLRAGNAERQRRYRERMKSNDRNVTITQQSNVEKRREEKNPPNPLLQRGDVATPSRRKTRAERKLEAQEAERERIRIRNEKADAEDKLFRKQVAERERLTAERRATAAAGPGCGNGAAGVLPRPG